jgi:hypothetical protein
MVTVAIAGCEKKKPVPVSRNRSLLLSNYYTYALSCRGRVRTSTRRLATGHEENF